MINIEQDDRSLTISYFNEEGKVDFITIQIPNEEKFEWIYSNERNAYPGVLSWDGKPVKKSATHYLNKYRITEFLMKQNENIQNKIFNENIPKKYYCDIETEVIDGIPTSENPECEITSIAITSEKNTIMVLATKPLSEENSNKITKDLNEYFKDFNKKIKFVYKYFGTEYDMLYAFFKSIVRNVPFITGWNFINFDWNYLVARAKYLNIDPTICSLTGEFDRNGLPLHKIVVDYLDVYKKWDHVIKIKESNSLDYVSNAALGVKKVKYPGTLNDLYKNDFVKFLTYNAVDAFLVRLLDEKLNTLIPYFKLGYLTRVENNKVFGPVAMVENIMVQQLWKDRKRVFVNVKKKQDKKKKYEGAYVMVPNPGLYKWLVTFDYSSLYPTNIRQWNISPDVFIEKDPNRELSSDIIKTVTGAIFKKNEDGVLRTLLTKFFIDRKKAKKMAGEIEEEIDYLKKILEFK